jgi:SOS-response transcriptional repressor LexA
MRDGGIHHGDLLVVEEDPSPEDGAVVVALLHGGEEVTVKRLRRENGNIRLRAQSDGYEDIVVAASEVEIQGRVVWTLHPS